MATAGTGVDFGAAHPLQLFAQVLHTPLEPLSEAPCGPGGREHVERISAPVEVVSGADVGDEPHSTDVRGKKQRRLGGVLLLPVALITGGAGDAQWKPERSIQQLESHLRASVGETPALARNLRHADGARQLDSLEQAGRTREPRASLIRVVQPTSSALGQSVVARSCLEGHLTLLEAWADSRQHKRLPGF